MAEIQRYDAVLATDACGNKDVLMRELVDGLFVRHEDHITAIAALREQIAGFPNVDAMRQAMIDTADENTKLRQNIERLSAPVSYDELASRELGCTMEWFNTVIAARKDAKP
jgi:hypothetical protein